MDFASTSACPDLFGDAEILSSDGTQLTLTHGCAFAHCKKPVPQLARHLGRLWTIATESLVHNWTLGQYCRQACVVFVIAPPEASARSNCLCRQEMTAPTWRRVQLTRSDIGGFL